MRQIYAVLVLLLLPSLLEAQKNCQKGIPCGNTCISRDKVCRIGTTSKPQPSPAYVAPIAVAPKATPDPKPWLAQVNGKVYYRATCQAAIELPGPLHHFSTETEAQQVGYRRSKVPGC
jgi:hypothetical protein